MKKTKKKTVKKPTKKTVKPVKKSAPKKAAPIKTKKVAAKFATPKPVQPKEPAIKKYPPVKLDLEEFRTLLELKRDDLNEVIRKKKEEVIPETEVGDEADVAVRSLERDLTFEQSGTELHILEEVEAALRRIDKGTYGVCEANGEPIAEARLRAMAYARYCVNCQARFESF